MATRIFTNTNEEIARAHDLIWKRYIPIFLFIRILTLVILTSGGGVWALGIDYITLLFLYFYATKPPVAEVLLGWSIFAAIKGDSDLEDALPNAIEKLNRAIIDIFIFIFIVPDTIGLLLPEIPFVVALSMICIGIGCGLLVVKVKWETTLFVSMVYASNVAILATTVVPYIDLGATESAQTIEKWLVEWKMIIGILMFFIAIGIMGSIWKESKEKTVGFLVWIFNWKHFLISIGAIIVIYIILSLVFPQATVWIDNFIATNQNCAVAMRKGEECLQVEATPQTPIKSPLTKLQEIVTDSEIKEEIQQSAAPKTSTQPVINEGEWDNIGVATCTFGGKKPNFRDGFCPLKVDNYPDGAFPKGEYRFKVTSTLTRSDSPYQEEPRLSIPPEGFSLSSFDAEMQAYVKQYAPLPNEGVWRLLLKKSGDEVYFPTSLTVSLREYDTLKLTVNLDNTPNNWKNFDFKGTVKIKILKKK